MKTKTLIRIFAMMIALCIFLPSCKKKDDDDDNHNYNPITVTDADGNVYTAKTIGTQVWMIKNLQTTKYNDGTAIPLITDNNEWFNLTTPAYCWYDNDLDTNGNTYGALYNWHAVNTGKLCPTGWHVPSDAEWTVLTDFLDGEGVAGGKLKEMGYSHWEVPNEGATNQYGFTALPGGLRLDIGSFNYLGYYGFWWSASEYDTGNSWNRKMSFSNKISERIHATKRIASSVRCVKD